MDEGKAESAGHEENGTHYYSASCSNVEIENFKVKNEIESTKRYTEFHEADRWVILTSSGIRGTPPNLWLGLSYLK